MLTLRWQLNCIVRATPKSRIFSRCVVGVDDQVGRLDVAVDQVLAVRIGEAFAEVLHQPQTACSASSRAAG